MRAVVVYASQTGFTRRYAEWIAEELGGEAVPVERADGIDAGSYDVARARPHRASAHPVRRVRGGRDAARVG